MVLGRYFLATLTFISVFLPWWALSAFPILSVGNAKVHALDLLVACTVLLTLPEVITRIRRIGPVLWAVVFVGYMAVPFSLAFADAEQLFFAIREARSVTYHLLVAAVLALRIPVRGYYQLIAVYVTGTIGAVVMAFLYVQGVIGLPGYRPHSEFATPGIDIIGGAQGFRLFYLDWIVLLAATVFMVARMVRAKTPFSKSLRLFSLASMAWYLVAAASRYAQALSLAASVALLVLLARWRALFYLVLTVLMLGLWLIAGADFGPPWVRIPVETALSRWTEWRTDGSLAQRTTEIRLTVEAIKESPLLGRGLGSAIDFPGYDEALGRYVNIASGYAFLALKSGLVGLTLYLVLLASLFRAALRALRRHAEPEVRSLQIVGLVGLGSLAVLEVLHPVVAIPEGAIALALFGGMAAVQGRSG